MANRVKIRTEKELKKYDLVDTSERPLPGKEIVKVYCRSCRSVGESKFCNLQSQMTTHNRTWICKDCTLRENSERGKKLTGEKNSFFGKKHSNKTRKQMKKSSKKRWNCTPKDVRNQIGENIRHAATEKYGGNPMLDQEIKDRQKNNLNRVLADPILFREREDKRKATNLERYGVEHTHQSPEILEKVKETFIKKYGSPFAISSPKIQEKIRRSYVNNDYCSKPELELRNWILETFSEYTVRKSYCGGSKPFEIDILIKKGGENVLAIEYNGDYWHSEANPHIHKNYHLNKTEEVREQKNCQLIHIFDSEWKKHHDRVKAFLSGHLQKGIPIRASKCSIIELNKKQVKEIFQTHLQGPPHGHVSAIGLEYKGEIISAMTFSKPHRQNMSEVQMSRYIIKPGYRIHGGLSKLSKFGFDKIGPFVTFVHKRLSNGNSYEKAGYSKIKDLPPDYWYWDSRNNKTVSKQSRKKSVVGTPTGMTEHEHALQDGLFRVWDCGKIKYLYD